MAFLAEIKKQVESVNSSRKITQAMQLVAANKMKYFQRQATHNREYAWKLLEAMSLCHHRLSDLALAEKRNSGKNVFVLITSDKGLCGALNVRLIQNLLKSKEWTTTPEAERLLITIGRKGYDYMNRRNIPIAAHFPGISERLDAMTAFHLINTIASYWDSGEAKKIYMVSTHYVNPFLSIPRLSTYLPFSSEMIAEHLNWRATMRNTQEDTNTVGQHFFFEPNEGRVIETLAHQLIHSLFMQSFNEFKAAEYSSRMVAMKKATEAADDMIKSLTLQYHKTRQAGITQQLCEIAAGSEATIGEEALLEVY